MKRDIQKVVFGIALVALSGCATSFTGSAHVEGGRKACDAKCRKQGMETAGMVYMGEYSSACVCEVPGTTGVRRREILEGGAAATAGAAGVQMQAQRQQQQQQQHGFR